MRLQEPAKKYPSSFKLFVVLSSHACGAEWAFRSANSLSITLEHSTYYQKCFWKAGVYELS